MLFKLKLIKAIESDKSCLSLQKSYVRTKLQFPQFFSAIHSTSAPAVRRKVRKKNYAAFQFFLFFFLYFYSFDIRIGFWTDFWLYSYASRQKNVKANTIVNNKRKKKKPHWLYFENTNTFVLLNFNSIFGKSSFFAYSVHHRWYNKVTPLKRSGAFERTKDFL